MTAGSQKDRRTFLGRMGALLAIGTSPALAAATAAKAPRTPAATGARAGLMAPDERWLLEAAQREHRIFVETGTVGDVTALRRTMNFLDAYKADYGIPETALGVVVGVHGEAIALALGDALWRQHGLGARLNLKDAAGAAPTANPFRRGSPFAIESLAKRGVHFLACNNSLRRLSGQLAGAGGNAQAMHTSLVAGVEGMQVVPAMAVAVSRAQERGIPYLVVG